MTEYQQMKTKLLRKIRKQYSIVYFKTGSEVYGLGKYTTDVFHVHTKQDMVGVFFNTKNECLDFILKEIREKYPRKKKKNCTGIKVWYTTPSVTRKWYNEVDDFGEF